MSDTGGGRAADLARTSLQLLALAALLLTAFWVLRPFLIAGAWAAMIAVATWPVLLAAQARLGGRRGPAVALLTTVLLLALVVPLYLSIRAIVDNAEDIASWSKALSGWTIPQPPAWLEGLPLFGARAASRWRDLAESGPGQLAAFAELHASDLVRWFVAQVGGIGALIVNFLLSTVFAAILYAQGEVAARGAQLFARRLAGGQGERSLLLAGQAVRAVALGVVVTAVVQTALVAIGFAVVGVPFAAILTALCFLLSIAQIGPTLVLIGVVVWAYTALGAGWGTAFLIWAVPCATVDNLLRPILIKRGADLPLLLILLGVIGGLIAFGVVGLFIGPVALAVGYTLLREWTLEEEAATP